MPRKRLTKLDFKLNSYYYLRYNHFYQILNNFPAREIGIWIFYSFHLGTFNTTSRNPC